MNHLGPSKVLQRGYSITTLEGSTTPLKDASPIRSGQHLVTRLARGELRSLVQKNAKRPAAAQPTTGRQPTLFDDDPDSGSTPEE